MFRIAFSSARPKHLISTAIIASVALAACSDATAPEKSVVGSLPAEVVLAPNAARSDGGKKSRGHSRKNCRAEVTFTKWYTTYPAMTGLTCYGPGTYSGEILKRGPTTDGLLLFTQLEARYEVRDPRGRHSFKAVIHGLLENATGKAVLQGVVIEGWRVGAPVVVTFQRVTECELAKDAITFPRVCFQGTIQIQKDKRDKGDRDSDNRDSDNRDSDNRDSDNRGRDKD